MQKTLTVVTACFNAKSGLERTIHSVLEQKCGDIEYIIVDGGSQDGTSELVKSYIPLLEKKGVEVVFVSESDQGVYDAMNKGLHMASGKWIHFLNAGDVYINPGILGLVIPILNSSEADVCYGDYLSIGLEGTQNYKMIPRIDNLKEEMILGHESTFFRTKIHKQFPFDLRFSIGADYDVILRMFLKKIRFSYLAFPIIRFMEDGISSLKKSKMYLDMQEVRINNHLIKDNDHNRNLIRRNAMRRKLYDEMCPRIVKRIWIAIRKR